MTKFWKSVLQLMAKQPTAHWQPGVKSIEINESLSTDFIGVWIKSFRRISYSAISIITGCFVLVIRCCESAEQLFKALIIHPWRLTFRARVADSHWRPPVFPALLPLLLLPGRWDRQRQDRTEMRAELVENCQISLPPTPSPPSSPSTFTQKVF